MFGRIFRGKSEEEKERDEEEIEEFIETKEKEFEKKYQYENEKIRSNERLIDMEPPPTGMPEDWIQIQVSFDFTALTLKLIGLLENEDQEICTLTTGGLSCLAEIGPYIQRVDLQLGSLEIKDNIHPNSRYNYLTHTVMDHGYDNSQFII